MENEPVKRKQAVRRRSPYARVPEMEQDLGTGDFFQRSVSRKTRKPASDEDAHFSLPKETRRDVPPCIPFPQ